LAWDKQGRSGRSRSCRLADKQGNDALAHISGEGGATDSGECCIGDHFHIRERFGKQGGNPIMDCRYQRSADWWGRCRAEICRKGCAGI
jgi:hypothetical protein